MGDPSVKPRGIRVRTACVSEAEFITAFQDVVDDSTVFAPTDRMKPVGAQCAFSLELADGTPMLRGLGLITHAWPGLDSPFGRPGMKIEIDQLTDSSEVIFEKLLNARTVAAANKPRSRPNPSTHQLWGFAPEAPRTEEMATPDPDLDEPEAAELPRAITRELRAISFPATDDSETVQAGPYKDPKPQAPEAPQPPRPITKPGAGAAPAPRAASTPVLPAPAAAVLPSFAPVEAGFDLSGALAASRPRPWWMNGRVGAVFAGGLVLGLMMSLAFRSGGGSKPSAKSVAAVAPKAAPASCPDVAALEAELAETKARAAQLEAGPAAAHTQAVAIASKPKSSASGSARVAKPAAVAIAKPATSATTKVATTATAPAATKASKPTAIATTKPATTTSKPSTIAATSKPAATTSKPATSAIKPTAIATTTSKPATTATKSTTTKPTVVAKSTTTTKPATVAAKPATVAAKPATVAAKPAIATAKPTTATTKPATATTKPAVASNSPTAKKQRKGGCSSLDCI